MTGGRGEVVDRRELDLDGRSRNAVTATLRFIDWEQPEHKDTQGYAVPRYSLRLEVGDAAESFTGWGSIHEAEQQEPSGTVRQYLDAVASDAGMFYSCGGRAVWLEESATVEAITNGNFAPVLDCMAEEWAIRRPSEAVRSFRAVVETARKLDRLGFGENGITRLHELVQELDD